MTVTTNDCVMPEADARRLTEKIRITAHTYAEAREKLIGYVEEAKEGNAHLALGYASWTAYLSEVLGEEPMRLARDERREVVQLLSNEGMSTRAIAPIVGVDRKTVERDVRGGTNVPPERTNNEDHEAAYVESIEHTPPFDPRTGEVLDGEPTVEPFDGEKVLADSIENAKKVTGLDGKTYTRTEPSKPRRRPITDVARDAGFELRKAIERVERLTEDDRFARNKNEVASHLRGHLSYAVEVCQDLLDRTNN